MNISFLDYQSRARQTAGPADDGVAALLAGIQNAPHDGPDMAQDRVGQLALVLRLGYATSGLANEAGEVDGKFKKLIRDRGGVIDADFLAMMVGELGDVLWYVADVCSVLGIHMSDVAKANIVKLKERAEAGTLQGDGDVR